jgi:4a-hydroxytetrahydrobiopterin dehydratase
MDTLDEILSSHCKPLAGSEFMLDAKRIEHLLALLPEWTLVEHGRALRREFMFADYYRTLAFVNALAFVAHSEDHHPDIGLHYNRCVVRYSTHDVGGISDNDFICAAKAEQLYQQRHT